MGTHEELVPGELLKNKVLSPVKYWVQQKFKTKMPVFKNGLTNKINEEIANV